MASRKTFVSSQEKALIFVFVKGKTTVLFTSLLILSSYYGVKEGLLNWPTETTNICSRFQLNLAIWKKEFFLIKRFCFEQG